MPLAPPPVDPREHDEALAVLARTHLGPYGSHVAREALASGALVVVEGAALEWSSEAGTMRALRVVLLLPEDGLARVMASPSAFDELTRVLASALAETPGQTLDKLELRALVGEVGRTSPYRGRR